MTQNYKLQITNYKSRDALYLGVIAASVSLAAFIFYYGQNAVLLYGDAVAHINIARRIFDSRDLGPLQLGTVWLPLPHILILPFIVSRWMWRTGVGGSIPSMVAYIAGALGLYRLVRRTVQVAGSTSAIARMAAWCAALTYVANPNLIYLQTTAMTEPLYLALFIWATVFFSEFVQQLPSDEAAATRSLRTCGILLMLCMLTRYDGWFAGAAFGATAAGVFARATPSTETKTSTAFGLGLIPLAIGKHPLRRFAMLLLAVPVIWLVYNAAMWGNPLEFATGPYSAKAIEERTATPSMPHHPGYHSVKVATLYFLKSAKLELGHGRWESVWIWLALGGSVLVVLLARRMWPLLLLWLPLPFYAFSISRGGVPIFFPEWWPHSYYNVRYGLQLLPAIAVFVAVLLFFVSSRLRRRWQILALAAVATFVVASYASVWRAVPICMREARVNSASRIPFERKLAEEFIRLPENSTVLMYIGDHAGALQSAGIPLRRTINETSHPFWQEALAAPAPHVDYAIAFGDDAVAQAVKQHAADFELVAKVAWPGQKTALIYRRR